MLNRFTLAKIACAVVALAAVAATGGGTPAQEKTAVPVGWDCICNKSDKPIRVFVTSGYGHFEAVLKPNQCAKFQFVKDGKDRALSAFTLTNDIVAVFPFKPLDQTGNPTPNCLPIYLQKDGAAKESKREPAGNDKPAEATNSPL